MNLDDIIIWADDFWCYRHELHQFTQRSDDYTVLTEGTDAYERFINQV